MNGPAPSPVITQLRAGGPDAGRVRVLLSDDSALTLPLEVVLELGLRSGEPVDEALRARLVDHEIRFKAREIALSLLSLRARSRRELRDRLRKREIPGRILEETLDALQAAGLQSDDDYARAFVRDRLRLRPRGRRALEAELCQKGVHREVTSRILDEVFEEMETDDTTLADRVAEAWLQRQPRKIRVALEAGPFSEEGAGAWRRGLGHMARKGFGSGLARASLERALRR